MDPLAELTLILFLAFIAEGTTEYFARPILAYFGTIDTSPMWLRYVAMIVGVALSLAYRADLLLMVGLEAIHPLIGVVLTGILIGRGSNYIHDLVDRFFQPNPKPKGWL
jgi:hypothetical protein